MRKDHLEMILALRERGKQMLQKGGLQQWRTEAVVHANGLSILRKLHVAGAAFDMEHVLLANSS